MVPQLVKSRGYAAPASFLFRTHHSHIVRTAYQGHVLQQTHPFKVGVNWFMPPVPAPLVAVRGSQIFLTGFHKEPSPGFTSGLKRSISPVEPAALFGFDVAGPEFCFGAVLGEFGVEAALSSGDPLS